MGNSSPIHPNKHGTNSDDNDNNGSEKNEYKLLIL